MHFAMKLAYQINSNLHRGQNIFTQGRGLHSECSPLTTFANIL